MDLGGLLEVLRQYSGLLDRVTSLHPTRVVGHVNVTGGEPLIRDDWFCLLEALRAAEPKVTFGVLTNGSLIRFSAAWRLRELRPRFVQVSIEGSEATHESIRGRGDYRSVLSALGSLVCLGVPTSVSFTAHKRNYREFPDVVRCARRLGASWVWTDRLIPAGYGAGLESLELSEVKEYVGIVRSAQEEAERSWLTRTRVRLGRALQFLAGGPVYHCSAGDELITILANGDVCPCRRMPVRVGNVLAERLTDIYFDSPFLKALRDPSRVARGCEACPHERDCRGGLRCLAFALEEDPFRADPGCWLAAGAVAKAQPLDGRAGTAPTPRIRSPTPL